MTLHSLVLSTVPQHLPLMHLVAHTASTLPMPDTITPTHMYTMATMLITTMPSHMHIIMLILMHIMPTHMHTTLITIMPTQSIIKLSL